jgi:hypothetical protein
MRQRVLFRTSVYEYVLINFAPVAVCYEDSFTFAGASRHLTLEARQNLMVLTTLL